MRGGTASGWVVDVDRVRAAGDRVVERAAGQDIVAREGVLADDAARLANANLRRGGRKARMLKPRDVAPEEVEKLHRLRAGFHLRAREVVGIQGIDVDDASHVD